MITPLLDLGVGLRYTKSHTGSVWKEFFVHTLSLNLRNDLFSIGISITGSKKKSKRKPAFLTNSWNLTLNPFFLKSFGGMVINYGESYSHDTGNPRKVDTVSKSWGMSFSKTLLKNKISFNYNYSGSLGRDKIRDSSSLSQSHSFSYSIYHSLWRLDTSLSGQFNHNENKQKAKARGGVARIALEVDWSWLSPPVEGEVVKGTSAVIKIYPFSVDELALYLDYPSREEVPIRVKWKVEISSDGKVWNTHASYTSFPLIFTHFSGFVRVTVVKIEGINPVKVGELKFMGYKLVRNTKGTVSYTTKNTSYKLSLSFGCSITESIRAGYNISYDRTIPDPGLTSSHINESGYVNWMVSKRMYIRTNLSHSIRKTKGSPASRNYSISIGSNVDIMEPLSLSFGYTHTASESKRSSSSSDSFYLSMDAQIYPGLESKWSHSYNVSGETRNYSSHFSLLARLKPGFTSTLDHNYSRSWGRSSTWSQRLTSTISWRISDLLSISASGTHTWDSSGRRSSSFTTSTGFIISSKMQASFGLSGSFNGERVINYNSSISWGVNRHLSLRFSYSGSKKEKGGNPWSWTLNITANF